MDEIDAQIERMGDNAIGTEQKEKLEEMEEGLEAFSL